MSDGYRIDPDYVDVAERIQLFYAKYPEGRLCTIRGPESFHVGERTFVWVQAAAYRSPDDVHPAKGTAWEPIPGPTPFTRDSEAMNAETAAWGRAIVATGIPSKKIASSDEVRARQPKANGKGGELRTEAQNRKMRAVISELDKGGEKPPDGAEDWTAYAKRWTFTHFGKESSKDLTKSEAGQLIDHLELQTVPFG